MILSMVRLKSGYTKSLHSRSVSPILLTMKNKTIKAYKIDAYANRIDTLELSDDYREISRNIGCECFCIAKSLPNGDTLYVDDEGYINANVTRGFVFAGQFFAGNGLVLGTNEHSGDSESVQTKELAIAELVKFADADFSITDEMRQQAMSSWKVYTL